MRPSANIVPGGKEVGEGYSEVKSPVVGLSDSTAYFVNNRLPVAYTASVQ